MPYNRAWLIHLVEGAHPMLGRCSPQRSLFDALDLPSQVPAGPSFGRMGCFGDLLFPGDDLAAMCFTDNRRPSLPSHKPKQGSKRSENAGSGVLYDAFTCKALV